MPPSGRFLVHSVQRSIAFGPPAMQHDLGQELRRNWRVKFQKKKGEDRRLSFFNGRWAHKKGQEFWITDLWLSKGSRTFGVALRIHRQSGGAGEAWFNSIKDAVLRLLPCRSAAQQQHCDAQSNEENK